MASMFRTAGVDTVVFDIQDAGARFYTYIWTMYTAMKAAVQTGARFVVLDRPNPIGGTARGPMMTTAYTSGVGAKEIVQAHGMTVGELARFFDGEFLEAEVGGRLTELQVIEVGGWRRDMPYAATGLPWVMPSPNMPTPDTALVYPGTGMFEGTNLSEGRGTTRPFELVGAPYVDYRWAERLAGLDLPGVGFREAYFNPTFSKHQGKVCGGVQVHITDPRTFDPMRVGVEMLVAAKAVYSDFDWRKDTWDAARPYWIDKLTGLDPAARPDHAPAPRPTRSSGPGRASSPSSTAAASSTSSTAARPPDRTSRGVQMRVRALAAAVAVGTVVTTMTTAHQPRRPTTSASRSRASPPRTPCCATPSPAAVGLDPAPIPEAVAQIRGHEQAPEGGHPMYAGAVA